MLDLELAPRADAAASGGVDRRTLLVGAAGAFAAAGLSGPARAAGYATSLAASAGPRFDPDLARRTPAGAARRAARSEHHRSGRDPARAEPEARRLDRRGGPRPRGAGCPMRRDDRFRAGSIAKPFVSVVVLQLAERGRLSLDARLPEVLPASVIGRFADRGRHHGAHAARPPQRDPGMGQPRRRRSGRARIPRRCGRSRSSSTSRPRSRRCSHPGRASSTPTPTTTCWG